MNMLARGARFLARTHDRFASSEVVYRRGASSQTLRATIGKTDFEVDQGDGMFTRFSSRDYLVTVKGILVGNRQMFEAMNRAITAHKIHPVIDRVFPFEQAEAAYRHLEGATHLGKVVISIP